METPPIPPVPEMQSRPCPNCGHTVEVHTTLCPHCGAALSGANAPLGAGHTLRIIGAILLALIALPLGAMGACFMLFAFAGNDFSAGLSGAGFGLGMAVVAGLLIWGAIRLAK